MTLEILSESMDRGMVVRAFTPVATVYAAVEPLKGKEYFDRQGSTSEVTHRVTIRHRSDVDATWRLKMGTRTFGIVSVINPDERNRELQMMCKEFPGGEPV